MKKLISFALAFSMLFSFGAKALAATITEGTSQGTDMTVSYGAQDSYIVTVPDSVPVSPDTGLGSITISAANVMLPSWYALNVYINGDSYANHQWNLTDISNSNNKLGYVIVDNFGVIQPNDVVLNVESGAAYNSTVNATLELRLIEECAVAGTYTDLLTFTVQTELQYQSLTGTYLLDISAEEMQSTAIVIEGEELEYCAGLTSEERDKYLLDTYGAKISPIVHHYNPTYSLIKATPMLYVPTIGAFYVFEVSINGTNVIKLEAAPNFYGILSFEASNELPEVSLLWIKQHGVKLSNNTESTHKFKLLGEEVLWYQGETTWLEWQNSAFYNECVRLYDGYIIVYHAGWLTLNGERVRATDVIDGEASYGFMPLTS